MQLQMSDFLALGYTSRSQIARVVTEEWGASELFCAACTSQNLSPTPRNTAAVDFICPNPHCQARYQLKARRKSLDRVADGSNDAMMKAINSDRVPNLLILSYSKTWTVTDLMIVPSFFFSSSAIETRRPLSPTARRANWVGCNILLNKIPDDGKIQIVTASQSRSASDVRAEYMRVQGLKEVPVSVRGWALDVLRCINSLGRRDFTLSDIYAFDQQLGDLHSENNNVRPKIRQQLQVLRDAGILEFFGRGVYRLK